MNRRSTSAATFAIALASGGGALGADPPAELKLGITTFLSGPAAVYGQPAKAAAEMIIEDMNAVGGIGGVPLTADFVDEGAGSEALLTEYRRLVQDVGVDAMFASISSGNCQAIAPLAEDLQVLNLMWECGTQRIFEDNDYRYVFRPQSHATPEMLAAALYLLKTKPDFKTIAVINQDYAWGRDSWDIFQTALKALKPDVEVVAEFFPAFGAPDYSTEISRLQAIQPDVILSTAWGGDLETLVRQAAQRGLMVKSTFVLPLAVSSLEQLGSALGEGHIVGARGDGYFLHPEKKNDPGFKAFVEGYRERTGAYPIHPVFNMSQTFSALEGAYEKAMAAAGGQWPDYEQVIEAMSGLTFTGLTRPVTIREDGQAVEDQLVGSTVSVEGYDFSVLGDMMIFDGDAITPPVGRSSSEWLETLDPSLVESVPVEQFSH